MLPRMDGVKAAIFIRRLAVFNETFAAVSRGRPNFTALRHECISGRKEDITSTFHRFLMEKRDEIDIALCLDNCRRLNKNWILFSMRVVLVNSDEIQANKITMKFFQPGHTFNIPFKHRW
ncbi:Cai-1 autoinducer sensor kinase/phosphatase cqss [Plakobranchus ocellatus]|uniref:Cai-1 autoinducer sensor kinase/phosphatase cqss n=1 Tax=Plakobranchus ocellatus TaxID=259542 RepID=A0AAV4B226_9GAST|nr:Cai-1 autoinducer sensor kinase/phosphatase cqss [Plakobranchus ocellatus]